MTLLLVSAAAFASSIQLGVAVGGWGVLNPATTIDVLAPEAALVFGWKKLQVSLVDHVFLTIAGPDHLFGLDVGARLPMGDGRWAPYVAPRLGVYAGGPLPVLPVARVEGGLLGQWEDGPYIQLGVEAMGSLRAVGVGPRVSFGWSL